MTATERQVDTSLPALADEPSDTSRRLPGSDASSNSGSASAFRCPGSSRWFSVTTSVGCCSGQPFVPRAIAAADVFEALTTLVDVSWTWAKWFIVIAISNMSPTDAIGR